MEETNKFSERTTAFFSARICWNSMLCTTELSIYTDAQRLCALAAECGCTHQYITNRLMFGTLGLWTQFHSVPSSDSWVSIFRTFGFWVSRGLPPAQVPIEACLPIIADGCDIDVSDCTGIPDRASDAWHAATAQMVRMARSKCARWRKLRNQMQGAQILMKLIN